MDIIPSKRDSDEKESELEKNSSEKGFNVRAYLFVGKYYEKVS